MTNNNKFTFGMIAGMLRDYKNLKRKALLLEFEIKCAENLPISDNDIIESMTFDSQLGEKVKGGQISDKTANTAMSYGIKKHKMKLKHESDLKNDLNSINIELERMEYYISLLDERHSSVLKSLYMDGLTFTETACKRHLSVSAIQKLRKVGIEKLVDMYNLLITK